MAMPYPARGPLRQQPPPPVVEHGVLVPAGGGPHLVVLAVIAVELQRCVGVRVELPGRLEVASSASDTTRRELFASIGKSWPFSDFWTVTDNADTGFPETVYTQKGGYEC
jgi:hypothetical protein